MSTKPNTTITFCLFQGAALAVAISAGAASEPAATMTEVSESGAAPALFIDDLAVADTLAKKPKCPNLTTFACGEEPNGCSGC